MGLRVPCVSALVSGMRIQRYIFLLVFRVVLSTEASNCFNDAGECEYLTFQRILAVDYVIPDDFSEHACHIIKILLLEFAELRIGAGE